MITRQQTDEVLRFTGGVTKDAAAALKECDIERGAALVVVALTELTDHINRLQEELDRRG